MKTGWSRILVLLFLAGAPGACGGSGGGAGPDGVATDAPAPGADGTDAVADGDGAVAREADAATTDPGTPDLAAPDDAPQDVASDPGAQDTDLPAGAYEQAFLAPELLGRPTATTLAVNLVPADALEVRLAWGATADAMTHQTATTTTTAKQPVLIAFDGLAPDARHFYQVQWRHPGDAAFQAGPVRSFHTQRPPGATFTFTLQADSHLDENSDLALYQRALDNIAADAADFHVDLGDTFMCEKHSQPLDATVQMAKDPATVDARYLYERGNFGRISHSLPLFLVDGNHEGESGWFLEATGNDIAVWTTLARQRYYANPVPDGFYTGDPTDHPFVGQRGSWYAWQWGDALFVVLDPFWYTMTKGGKDSWVFTLGDQQYAWLQQTLAASTATFKFVFIHNLVGGLDGQMRGGAEAAPFYEWGGKNEDGSDAFAQKRPGWAMPIHQLLVQHGVTAVFHGHDHLYAKQDVDGIVYQEMAQPSAPNFTSGPNLATQYHYASGTILSSAGHLRVTVSPAGVRVEYVRAYRPADENGSRHNGQVDDDYTIPSKPGSGP